MATAPQSWTEMVKRRELLWALAFATVVAIAVSAYLLIRRAQEQRQPNVVRDRMAASLRPAASPLYFTDFIGVAQSVAPGSMVLEVVFTNARGVTSTKRYQVAFNEKTQFRRERASGFVEPAILSSKDVQVGDMVHVFGPDNLYPVDQFTATKIHRRIP